VTQEIYIAHHETREKIRSTKKSIRKNELSLEQFEERGIQPTLAEPIPLLSDVIINREYIKKLEAALKQLSEDEYRLIKALFFEGVSERSYAENLGVTQQCISKRKMKILNKLKKILEK
jgi:RNA polymerase sigma factor (sigma-70 family)